MHFEIIVITLKHGNQKRRSVPAQGCHNSDHTQKPSNARLTQLNANIEQTIAAADANVAIALTDRMTEPFVGNDAILFDNPCSIMARFLFRQ